MNYDHENAKLVLTAISVEDNLLLGGAKPEKDYSILDCFKMAVELMKCKSMDNLSISFDNIASAIDDVSCSLDCISTSIDEVNV